MSRDLNLPHGPREYIIQRCPYCRRRLAEWFAGDDHVTHLYAHAAVVKPCDTYLCLRPRCRLRRRLRLRPPLTPEVP